MDEANNLSGSSGRQLKMPRLGHENQERVHASKRSDTPKPKIAEIEVL